MFAVFAVAFYPFYKDLAWYIPRSLTGPVFGTYTGYVQALDGSGLDVDDSSSVKGRRFIAVRLHLRPSLDSMPGYYSGPLGPIYRKPDAVSGTLELTEEDGTRGTYTVHGAEPDADNPQLYFSTEGSPAMNGFRLALGADGLHLTELAPRQATTVPVLYSGTLTKNSMSLSELTPQLASMETRAASELTSAQHAVEGEYVGRVILQYRDSNQYRVPMVIRLIVGPAQPGNARTHPVRGDLIVNGEDHIIPAGTTGIFDKGILAAGWVAGLDLINNQIGFRAALQGDTLAIDPALATMDDRLLGTLTRADDKAYTALVKALPPDRRPKDVILFQH